MIKSLTITNHLGDSIVLELMRPEKSGFIVKSIAGLGPVKANINMTSYATCDGSVFNSAFMDTRDIILTLLYCQSPEYSIEDIRQKSYKYFPNKKKVHIIIETDNRTVWTEGYVEDNSPEIFSQTAGSVISIRCPDPYLYSLDEANTIFYGIEPTFKFPFENTSTEESLLNLGNLIVRDVETVVYEGDREVGCTITIDITGPVSNIEVCREGGIEKMSLNTSKLPASLGTGFIKDDTVVLETSVGKKGVTLIRDGVHYNILNCLSKDSTWFVLSKGDNIFYYVVGSGKEYVRFRISNKVVYYGV